MMSNDKSGNELTVEDLLSRDPYDSGHSSLAPDTEKANWVIDAAFDNTDLTVSEFHTRFIGRECTKRYTREVLERVSAEAVCSADGEDSEPEPRTDGGEHLNSDETSDDMTGPDGERDASEDSVDQYEPVELDRTGTGGVSKDMVVDIIQSIAGPEPFEDGTLPHKTHSRRIRVHLAPEVDVETIAEIVHAFERLNLLVSAKEDGRFSDGVKLRGLTVSGKAFTEDYYPDRSPWWDSAGLEPEVVTDE